MKTKEEILNEKSLIYYIGSGEGEDIVEGSKKDVFDAMDEYAKEQMIQLIENISRQSISCYSQKIGKQEKQYFLWRTYVEDLIKRIRQ